MKLTTIEEYRAEVIELVACAFCSAEAGEPCWHMLRPSGADRSGLAPAGHSAYVHDERSLAHYRMTVVLCDG